jgi:hypothetical protein
MKQVIADFRVERKTELYETLNAAVAAAYADELDDRSQGVLVIRHDFNHFSVALSSDVPFGLIHEHDEVRRN